ncbi:hypothetical protein [Variovorax sp. PDC80]|uniref:hypothetical protein n=1 Tax=unclassified Variovorax TaxID=663243 RepID=UPI0008E30BE9|nr:hypothetical protein [Variovorax sp. PDC80]SFO91522.1 hypothetical protein SAMN05443579_107145 [Variovorax sp. PDC80]
MRQDITLNIPYDLSNEEWEKVAAVYASLDGWLDDQDGPAWYGREGDARYIGSSVEPSGIQFFGEVETLLWTGWLTVLCARMSLALGREVHDAEV